MSLNAFCYLHNEAVGWRDMHRLLAAFSTWKGILFLHFQHRVSIETMGLFPLSGKGFYLPDLSSSINLPLLWAGIVGSQASPHRQKNHQGQQMMSITCKLMPSSPSSTPNQVQQIALNLSPWIQRDSTDGILYIFNLYVIIGSPYVCWRLVSFVWLGDLFMN